MLAIGNSSIKAANLTGYFIYKHDTRISSPLGRCGDNADLYTVGGRLSGLFGANARRSWPSVPFTEAGSAFCLVTAGLDPANKATISDEKLNLPRTGPGRSFERESW